MKPRRYATAAAFKAALNQRLRQVASGADITRRRQLLVFDRYLARLGRVLGDAATLKGGPVLKVRLDRARTTRDIDLRLAGALAGLLERLQEAGRLDLSDFMTFELRADARHPDIAGPGVQYEGQRFRAECPSGRSQTGRAVRCGSARQCAELVFAEVDHLDPVPRLQPMTPQPFVRALILDMWTCCPEGSPIDRDSAFHVVEVKGDPARALAHQDVELAKVEP